MTTNNEDWLGCIDNPEVLKRFLEVAKRKHLANVIRVAHIEGHRTVGVIDGIPVMSEDMHQDYLASHGEVIPENN